VLLFLVISVMIDLCSAGFVEAACLKISVDENRCRAWRPACAMFRETTHGSYSGKQHLGSFPCLRMGKEARDSSVVWAGFSLSEID
jgi:hypothetical protein